ncbi:ribonuclease H-like domain-containing protein [Tanacetum coccineum]|uniref:Ribonuclease H-like domain-containing protein n=1 Tax=Tanacetum coccineum TaxID=301880 RepID=A0ABQ5EWB2_9ASTR
MSGNTDGKQELTEGDSKALVTNDGEGPEPVVNESNVECQPKVWSDAPIIEEYESDSEDECVSIPTKQQETPSFANKQVKTPRETVKNQFTHIQKPKVDKKDLGHGFTVRACFVCGSLNHLIRDCDFHEKRMARKAELNNGWNNVQRVNKQNQFVPSAVLTRTGIIPVNTARTSSTKYFSTARQSVNRQTVLTYTAKESYTVKPIISTIGEKGKLLLSLSRFVIEPQRYHGDPKTMVDPVLKNVTLIKDPLGRPTKQAWVMFQAHDWEQGYLAELQDINVALLLWGHFNLFSVSQICDKKNKVLFTDSECLVLSSEFKLPDENQVLLKIPRQNNMYSFNLENIVPSGGLACLIAKATTDESNKWHRRLGHVNFKNLNRLVKGNLVRGLPLKNFKIDPHLCCLSEIKATQGLLQGQNRDSEKEDESAQDCFVLPIWPSYSSTITPLELWPVLMWDYPLSIPTNPEEDDSEIPPLEDIYQHSTEGIFTTSSYDDEGSVADFTNLETVVNFKQEANSQKFGAPAFVSYVQSKGDHNHKDFQHCLFACFRAQHEPKKISEALKDESWVDAMQEELIATEEVPKGKPKLVFGNLECLHLTLESYSNWTKLSQSLQEITTGGSNLVEDTFLGNAKKRQTICANFLLQKQSIARLQAPVCGKFCGFISIIKYIIQNKAHCYLGTIFIREAYEKKLIQVLKIHTDDNVADLLTKAFDVSRGLKGFRELLSRATNGTQALLLPTLFFLWLDKVSTASVNPTISTTFVEQFWTSTKSKTINNVRHITAKVAGKSVSISEAYIRSDLRFDDADGIDTLPNQAIFNAIQQIGYEGDLTKGKHFSGKVTPLFATMLVQPTQDEGAPSERPSEAQPTPSPAPTSKVPNEPQTDSSPAQTSEVPIEQQTDLSPRPSPTPIIRCLSRNLVRILEVSDQAKEIQLLKAQITKLKKQAKPVIKHHRAWLKSVSMKQRFPSKSFSKNRVHKESVSKQGRKDEGSTREMVDEDKGIDEIRLSTEDVVSTDKEVVSTDKEKVSTDRPIVSTNGSKISTDRQIEGTDEQIEGTEELIEGTEEQVEIFGDDETIAKVLLNMSQAKAVSREKEKWVELKDIEEADRPRPTSTRSLLEHKASSKMI